MESLKKNHPYYLEQLGITQWVLRSPKPKNQLDSIRKQVERCTACSLHQGRTQTVFARGNPSAKIFIIGEAPGYHEDQQGAPFVGKAGGLLNKMLLSIGLKEEDVYIANVLKCRPPQNRDPQPEEVQACAGFLEKQIALIDPKCILAVGRFAGQFILKQSLPMHKMRNQVFEYHQKPVIVSFHPAYLLRNPRDKKNAFSDLIKLRTLFS